eukprot:CAMPEP_0115019032 /NCGR_PEP_ID=MMETSP0216-20121206/29184_1 /TAXON_ID=223996 /ORGANISM="Protocruzia adherens, Strain Boccale" /LENGTH=95 /DNA_ID=CAMNT_0002390389 /DNA_START=32 /DNA_END=319 /DNA_ORIENTATION=+
MEAELKKNMNTMMGEMNAKGGILIEKSGLAIQSVKVNSDISGSIANLTKNASKLALATTDGEPIITVESASEHLLIKTEDEVTLGFLRDNSVIGH